MGEKAIEPEVLWAFWSPHGGFATYLGTHRGVVIQRSEKINGKSWAELRKAGCKAVKVVVAPFNWDVMIEARKAQNVK